MAYQYDFRCEHVGCSIAVKVVLGLPRRLELLVNGNRVLRERVKGRRAKVCVLYAALPCDPPTEVAVEIGLPGLLIDEPTCVLVAAGVRLPMLQLRPRAGSAGWQ